MGFDAAALAEENDRIMADLCRAQPPHWVEDRRERLTVPQAERGVQPAKYTRLEWRRMNDASRAYADACVMNQLTRAKLGP